MKKILITLVTFLCVTVSASSQTKVIHRGDSEAGIAKRRIMERTASSDIEKRIDHFLKAMTLEEKIGQMVQLNYTLLLKDGSFAIDSSKLISLVKTYHVGSFLNGIAYSPEAWYKFSKELQEIYLRNDRLKIPVIFGIDHMHGANYVEGATGFPHNMNMGCTFNKDLAAREGTITGMESADLGHHWVFSPVVDLGRNPDYPRFYESYSEDPYLCGEMGARYVRALQNNPAVAPYKQAACAKHFLAYSDPHSGWDRTPVDLSDQTIQEFFVPSFKAIVDAGVMTFMIHSGEIGGTPVHASYQWLTQVLRDQLGFKGVAVSDWEDVIRLYSQHKVAHDIKEAAYLAVTAGIDMSMTPYTTTFFDALRDLVKEGKIPESRIDLSVARILRLKFELGLFDNPYPGNKNFNRIGSSENKATALQAASESLVLMKNDGTLPLKPTMKKVVLTGPVANIKRAICGGWTLRWIPESDDYFPKEMPTLYTALKSELKDSQVELTDPGDLNAKAADADVIIVAVGDPKPYSEGKGSFNDRNLPENQINLIRDAQATGKPVVVVLIEGRPLLITKEYYSSNAVLFAGLPGFEGAQAIAEVLSGKTNPSGKLSFSYPSSPSHFFTYNHKPTDMLVQHEMIDPRTHILEFGNGLSYTTFDYSGLSISDTIISGNKQLTAKVTVKNTGLRAGKESVLWYLTDEVGLITRPVKALKFFEKKELQSGESQRFTFVIDPKRDLSYPDGKGQTILEEGYFTLSVGKLTARFKYQGGQKLL